MTQIVAAQPARPLGCSYGFASQRMVGQEQNGGMGNELDLARRLYEVLIDDDVEPFLALCAPHASVEYPAAGRLPYGGVWRGREAIHTFLTAHDAAEEILEFEPREMHEAGERVFVLGRFEGRATATGRTWATEFVHVLTITGGLLHRWQSFFDTAAALDAHAATARPAGVSGPRRRRGV